MADLRYKGEGYCDRCEMYTFYGRHVSSVEDRKKWEFVCEQCWQADGENDGWSGRDEEDLNADCEYHTLKDDGEL